MFLAKTRHFTEKLQEKLYIPTYMLHNSYFFLQSEKDTLILWIFALKKRIVFKLNIFVKDYVIINVSLIYIQLLSFYYHISTIVFYSRIFKIKRIVFSEN